jgi:putative addiction module antidote
MNTTLKVTRIGNSAGLVLPTELLARLRAGVGDAMFITEAPDGIRITASDPSFEIKMALADGELAESDVAV